MRKIENIAISKSIGTAYIAHCRFKLGIPSSKQTAKLIREFLGQVPDELRDKRIRATPNKARMSDVELSDAEAMQLSNIAHNTGISQRSVIISLIYEYTIKNSLV